MKSTFKIYEIHKNTKGNTWDSTYTLIEPNGYLGSYKTDTKEQAAIILSENAIIFVEYVILEVFKKE